MPNYDIPGKLHEFGFGERHLLVMPGINIEFLLREIINTPNMGY